MKTATYFLGLLGVLLLFSFCKVNKNEDEKELNRFIVEAIDARLMDREEGKLAVLKGTTSTIKDYGNKMVKDQTLLLEELKKLAKEKNIEFPTTITEKKSKNLEKLGLKSGTDFDKKFLNMIKIDHKRDVKEFKNASEYSDVVVNKFAIKYLPMIKMHLQEVKQIIKNR